MPADPYSAIAGLGLGLIGGIGSLFGAASANRRLQKLLGQEPSYQENPLVKQRLGLAQSLLNARMPGATAAERNIYGNQAAQMANINRNATDASQALALGAGAQGQTNQAFQGLAAQEAQDYQRRYGNLVGAQQAQVQEGDKAYQDRVRQFEDLAAIRGAQTQNTQNAWNSLSNLGLAGMNFGLQGGFSGMFNRPKNNQTGYNAGVPPGLEYFALNPGPIPSFIQ